MSFQTTYKAVWAVISSALWWVATLPIDALGLITVPLMVALGYDGKSTSPVGVGLG